MRDLAPEDAAVRRRLEKGVGRVLASGGFARLDTPLLERADLFIRKSGGEIAGSLYAFTDPGGVSVSLRPEFTPSIIRRHVQNAPPDGGGETRYRYSGPVFRYGEGARFRQFQQAGAELIGVPGADGDFEILRTAIDCLQSAGARHFRVRIGHVGVLRDLLDSSGISERARMFILSNVAETTQGADGEARLLKKAAAAGLILDGRKAAPPPRPSRRDPDAAQSAAATSPALAALEDSISGPTGRRSAEMILSRLIMRQSQAANSADFRAAIRNAARLAGCADSADPQTALARAKAVLRDCAASADSLGELEDTLDRLRSANACGASPGMSIDLDFSFVRGLAYYTGAVFEFAGADGGGASYPLGGGGRYDDLVKAFGGADTPACGFALDLDELSLQTRAPDAANKAAR